MILAYFSLEQLLNFSYDFPLLEGDEEAARNSLNATLLLNKRPPAQLTLDHWLTLTHSPLVPFGTLIQLTVGANDAWGYIDTGNILALINLQLKLSDQLCKS